MISKKEFRDLVNYIKNRPDEARELMAALTQSTTFYFQSIQGETATERGATGKWLTASEVGKEMGKSHQWVKDHDEMLPDSAKRLSANGRRARLYLWNDNTRHLFNIQL